MKNFLFIVFLAAGVISNAQNNVGIGTLAPDASSILDLTSTQRGMLVPRVTALQRLAITTPARSLLVYDTDSSCFFFYDVSWRNLCVSISGGVSTYSNIAAFTLSSGDHIVTFTGNTGGTAQALILPTLISGVTDGRTLTLINIGSGTGWNLTAATGNTVNLSSGTLFGNPLAPGGRVVLVAIGTTWYMTSYFY